MRLRIILSSAIALRGTSTNFDSPCPNSSLQIIVWSKYRAPNPEVLCRLVLLSAKPAGSLELSSHHRTPLSQLGVMVRPVPRQVHSVCFSQTILVCFSNYALSICSICSVVDVLSDFPAEQLQDGPPHHAPFVSPRSSLGLLTRCFIIPHFAVARHPQEPLFFAFS